MWSPKSRKKNVNKIFPSQRNTNHNFWLPDGKFWSPIFLLRIRTKRTRLPGVAMAIYRPNDERIECRLYTQLLNVLSQLNTFSCLYLLETKYTRFKKTAGWFFALCLKRSFLSRSVKTIDGSPCCSHHATTVQHFSFKKHGGEASHWSSCEPL